MAIKIENTDNLIPYALCIEEVIKNIFKEIEDKIIIGDVLVKVKETEHPNDLNDIGGVGGYCPNGDLIELSVNINNPLFKKSWDQLIRRSLLHELHHAVRRRSGIAIGESTFLECLFSEGLADHFVYEMTGQKPVWATDLEKEVGAELLARAKKIFDQPVTDELYKDWFTEGFKTLGIPRWTGYSLGYKLVGDYLSAHPDSSSASLVVVPASTIV
jgi:hypothetical protein